MNQKIRHIAFYIYILYTNTSSSVPMISMQMLFLCLFMWMNTAKWCAEIVIISSQSDDFGRWNNMNKHVETHTGDTDLLASLMNFLVPTAPVAVNWIYMKKILLSQNSSTFIWTGLMWWLSFSIHVSHIHTYNCNHYRGHSRQVTKIITLPIIRRPYCVRVRVCVCVSTSSLSLSHVLTAHCMPVKPHVVQFES